MPWSFEALRVVVRQPCSPTLSSGPSATASSAQLALSRRWNFRSPRLHQLCAPLLDQLACLPAPQRAALAAAFGLEVSDRPDRFLISLALLSLLADAAQGDPLLCLIDDAQWLDRASALALGFVARRLGSESIVLMFAVRDPFRPKELVGLPCLNVEPLHDEEARELLASVIGAPLDERVRARILDEARGNPLALLELPERHSC